MTLHRSRFVRLIRARPRLFIAAALGLAAGLLLPRELAGHGVTRALVGWNTGTVLYIVLATVMMSRSSERHMLWRAQLHDEGQSVILFLVALASIASLVAIAGQLNLVKETHGLPKLAHLALAGLTVLSTWAFTQVMFTLHYAHDYYAAVARKEPAPLQFPGETAPDYGDFFYFAAVIGTSGQTADVAFVSPALRRVGSVHCILAYAFNTTVLALLINIGASLL